MVCRGEGRNVLATAMTGLAASLYDAGRTVHYRFGIPVPVEAHSTSKVRQDSSQAELIRSAQLIICDEVSMANKYVFSCIDRLLKLIMGNNLAFGGKCLVCSGDFRQTAPIDRFASQAEIINLSLTKSNLWREFTVCRNLIKHGYIFNASLIRIMP